jgi:hypothetical protein
MSLLLGQYGSLQRDDFVQPPLQSAGPNIVAKGSYLQPGPYASVSVDDRSRFRNTAFVPPVSIELMTGFMDYGFYNTNVNLSSPVIMPTATYVHQSQPQVRKGYAFSTVPSSQPRLGALRGVDGGATTQVEPYGQVVNGPVSPRFCGTGGGVINASGACQVQPGAPLYDPDARNVYF